MPDYIFVVVLGIALLLLFELLLNNRRERKKIRKQLVKIEELRQDSTDFLDFHD